MKICERCGHQNWEIIRIKDKEACANCERPFEQAPQCAPMEGQSFMTYDEEGHLVQGGNRIGPIRNG